LGKLRFSICTLLLVLTTQTVRAQEWKLKMDRDGIKIYTQPYGGSKIQALKVICSLEARLSQLATILLDIKHQDEWFYHTRSSLLTVVSPAELYYYSVINFPMPFSNRDFVEHIRITQNPDSRIITMDVENLPDYIKVKPGIVRIIQSQCKWTISPAGPHLLLIEFKLFANPAGAMPFWLVNMFSTYGPFETFKKLRLQVLKPEYQNAHLSFIKD
jgi:hypothetical protein